MATQRARELAATIEEYVEAPWEMRRYAEALAETLDPADESMAYIASVAYNEDLFRAVELVRAQRLRAGALVPDAEAERTADELVGPPIDNDVTRAFGGRAGR